MSQTIAVPQPGTALPDIPLTSADGLAGRLSEEIAGAPAVVFFMRAADCAVCAGHARMLARMASSGELRGARAVVVAPGDAGEAARAAQRIGDPALVVRASGDHHADLGLGRFLMLQHSGTFVTDASGTILHARTSAMPTASFSAAEVTTALASV